MNLIFVLIKTRINRKSRTIVKIRTISKVHKEKNFFSYEKRIRKEKVARGYEKGIKMNFFFRKVSEDSIGVKGKER